ncbi:MAG: hypothetical protein IT444_12395 [Phycisphaeraceae bacterium]|nr:hypothetical protein [Phycisphaeraceae bacterium]
MIDVTDPSPQPPEPVPPSDALVVALLVALVHARSKGDYLRAANAHRELEQLGVLVRFPRRRKGVGHD